MQAPETATFVTLSSMCRGASFTKGETEMIPPDFLRWLIKRNILDSQHTQVMDCWCFSRCASVVDLFPLVWRSGQILFKEPEWMALHGAPGRHWWVSRSSSRLAFLRLPCGSGREVCLLCWSQICSASRSLPAGRCHRHRCCFRMQPFDPKLCVEKRSLLEGAVCWLTKAI